MKIVEQTGNRNNAWAPTRFAQASFIQENKGQGTFLLAMFTQYVVCVLGVLRRRQRRQTNGEAR